MGFEVITWAAFAFLGLVAAGLFVAILALIKITFFE